MSKGMCAAIMALIMLAGCGPSEKEIAAAKDAAETAQAMATMRDKVARRLRDPESAQFRDERLTAFNAALCGEVNGKNAFGAYIGFKRFYTDNITSPYLDDTGSDFEQRMFDSMWRTHCQAPAGR